MMKEKNKEIQSRISELRKFSMVMTIFLALLGGLFLWRNRSFYWCFFVLSVLFAGCGLVRPTILGPVYKAWMKVSHIIGGFMSRVILLVHESSIFLSEAFSCLVS